MVDGSITINTKIDQSGFKSGRQQIESGLSGIKSSLKGLASAVGIAFGAAAVVSFGKETVKTANELSNAMQGLQSIVEGQGRSFSKAQSFINDYVSDGLVPLANATTAYKNLAARGYSDDQIQKVMTALKDSAAFGRQANYSLGDAVTTATEGLKNENSILVDNAGVTKNVAKMWEDYAKSIGTSSSKLTQEQKIQAEVNGILTETRFQTGDAAKIAGTYSGQVARLSYHFTELKTAIGNSIIPILQAIMPYIDSAIQGLTRLFNTFGQFVSSIFGTQSEQIASGSEKATKAQDDLATATDNVTESTKKSTKAAKDNLAAFDELNVRQKDSSSGDSAGSGSVSTNTNSDDSNNKKKNEPNANSTFKKIKSAITTAYKDLGFDNLVSQIQSGFGKIDFSAIKKNFQSTFNSFKSIVSGTLDGVKKSISSWSNYVGTIIGGVVQVFGKQFQTISGGISKFFTDYSNKITDGINAITSNVSVYFDNMSQVAEHIFDSLGGSIDRMRPTMETAISNLLGGLTTFGLSVGEVFSGMFAIWSENLNQWTLDNQEKIGTVFDSFQQLGADLMNLTGSIFGDIGDSIKTWWNDELIPIWDDICKTILGIADTVMNVWNEWIYPVIKTIIEVAQSLWDNTLSPVFSKVISVIGKIGELVLTVWNNFLKPVVDWLVGVLTPIIKGVLGTVKNVLDTIFKIIGDVVGGVLDALGGLLDFIIGVFTGDWEKAWNGIKNFFKGIWNGIIGIVNGAVNLVIDILNALWSGLYYVLAQIINSVGSIVKGIGSLFGQDWGWSIPTQAPQIPKLQIPRLATGAVIPPNSEFLAVLGDQRKGRNLEAPESLIRKIVREESGGGDNREVVAAINNLTNVLINKKLIDSPESFAREYNPFFESEKKRSGNFSIGGFVN